MSLKLTDLLEGMSDKEFADAQEKDRLEKHPERDKIKAIQALLAKEKSMKEDLFSKDGGNEDNVDNIDKVASPDAKASDYSSAISSIVVKTVLNKQEPLKQQNQCTTKIRVCH